VSSPHSKTRPKTEAPNLAVEPTPRSGLRGGGSAIEKLLEFLSLQDFEKVFHRC